MEQDLMVLTRIARRLRMLPDGELEEERDRIHREQQQSSELSDRALRTAEVIAERVRTGRGDAPTSLDEFVRQVEDSEARQAERARRIARGRLGLYALGREGGAGNPRGARGVHGDDDDGDASNH